VITEGPAERSGFLLQGLRQPTLPPPARVWIGVGVRDLWSPCARPCVGLAWAAYSACQDAGSLVAVWDQGQGIKGGSESPESYDRFVQFLELGSDRTLTALAKVLGVSYQALQQTAKRFSWRERAAAWDRSRTGTRKTTPPKGKGPTKAPPAPAAPPPPPPPPPSPPPASTAQPIDPEVLGLELGGEVVGTHLQAMARYQRVYDAIGYGMAMQAYSLFPVVQSLQNELAQSIELRKRLREQTALQEAALVGTTIRDLIPQYAKLCDALHTLANGGRTHWGDAIGVHRILEEAFGATKNARGQGGGRG